MPRARHTRRRRRSFSGNPEAAVVACAHRLVGILIDVDRPESPDLWGIFATYLAHHIDSRYRHPERPQQRHHAPVDT